MKKLFFSAKRQHINLFLTFFILVASQTFVNAQVVVFSPTADAYVRDGSYGNTNFGNDTSLIVKSATTAGVNRLSYLKFSIGTITTPVKSAKIRVYGYNSTNTSTIRIALFGVNDDSWTETGITFNNAPPTSGSSLSSVGVNNLPGYYEFDVTDFVKAQSSGDKIVSVYLKDTTIKNAVILFNSKENAQFLPQLTVDTTPTAPPPSPIALSPVADAYVRNGTYSNTNYGNDTALAVKSSVSTGVTRLSYLKFSLNNVVNIRSAKVRLYGLNKDNSSTINIALFGVSDDSWTETGINFNNAPVSLPFSLRVTGVNNVAGYYEFDITDFVKNKLKGDKLVSVVLKDTATKNSLITFNSKESIQNTPQLVIDTATSAAQLFVENMDKFPSNDHIVFSHVHIPWTRDTTYNANHDSIKVRLHNNGTDPLIISNLQISVDTLWKIDKFNGLNYNAASQLPATVNPGSYLDLMVKFIANNLGTSSTRVKVLHQSLTITSNDNTYSDKKIYLDGIWQYSGEGAHEPYSQEVLKVFNYKTLTGFTNSDPDKGDSTKLKGDEIKPDYFLIADSTLPINVHQLNAYHGCCHSTEAFKWFYKGTTTYNTVFTALGIDAQSLLPRKSTTGAAAAGTFTPTTSGAFGVLIGAGNSTAPYLNTSHKLGVRVYKAIDGGGNIVPNTYILANDYLGPQSNYDFNDNMYYVDNIKPYIGTVYNSLLNVAPSDIDFGEHILQTSDSLQLNISSGGKTYSDGSQDPPLTISSIAITGENQSEFSAEMPLVTTLAPQQATTIKVKFNPASQGLKIADLLIYYNNSQSPKRVPLYGIAKGEGVTVTANYRVNSGASTPITINGKMWAADNQYAFDNLEPYKNPALKQIACTDEDSLYFDEQSSNADQRPFRYQFPITNGDYYVRLHFAEIYWGAPGSGLTGGAGSRVFSVNLENQPRLLNYDLIQDVGVATAVIKNFPVTVTDGNLNIDFSASVNRPTVSAVEVYSFSAAAPRAAVATTNNLPAIDQTNASVINTLKPRLYPNPITNANLNINFPNNYKGIYDIQLVDLLGRKYDLGKTTISSGGNIKLDISRLSLKPGIYFLNINSRVNKTDVLKLLIQ